MSSYSIDSADVGGAIRNLNHIVNVICQIRFELGPGENDDRVDSLLWVARDLSEGIVNQMEAEADKRVASKSEGAR